MNNDTIYVDKKQYDCLLRKHLTVLRERGELKRDWGLLKDATIDIDDQLLNKTHQFYGSVEEEMAYLTGVKEALSFINDLMKKFEENRYETPDRKQD